MFKIKFNAIDIYSKIVYCGYKVEKENEKPYLIERTFHYDKFVEAEPKLLELLKGDIYFIYLEDGYSEKKYLDGTIDTLTKDEIEYCSSLITKACINLEYENLLLPPSIDEEIDDFIKEFFNEEDPSTQKDFLENFFAEIENKNTTTIT